MGENMTLLSQEEIDTLIDFILSNSKERVGDVLDQQSIDKLITILRAGAKHKLHFDTVAPQRVLGKAFLVLEGVAETSEQRKDCSLECRINKSNGYLQIVCSNKKNGKECIMNPSCLESLHYVQDGSEWGYCIPPLTFDNIAAILDVTYTKETFDFVCEIYAEKVYGDKKHEIVSLYMPTANSLIHHLSN